MPPKKITISIILLLAIILTAGEFYNRRPEKQSIGRLPRFSLGANVSTIKLFNKKTDAPAKPNPIFPKVNIVGKSAIVYDIENKKIIFAKEENKAMPLASITKLMTVLVAKEEISGTTVVPINAAAVALGGGTRLRTGEQYRLTDLSDLTLVGSLNEGAAAIAAATERLNSNKTSFVDLMNNKASSLGMSNTHFLNETGLDLNGEYGGSYGSALDVAKLFSYIVKNHPDLVEATKSDFISSDNGRKRIIGVPNTNQVVNKIPGLLASKTGYTDIADGNLGVVIDAGIRRPIAIVVLGSSKNGRFSDIEILVKATHNYLETE